MQQQVDLLEQQKELLEEKKRLETEAYNKGIKNSLNNSSYDFDDRTADVQTGANVLSGKTAAFDPSSIMNFMIEIDNLKAKMNELNAEGKDTTAISQEITDYTQRLTSAMKRTGEAFGGTEADIASMDKETAELYSSFLRLQSIFQNMDNGESVASSIVKNALKDDDIKESIADLKDMATQGTLTKEKLMEFGAFKEVLDANILSVDDLINEIKNLSDESVTPNLEVFDISDIKTKASELSTIVSGVDSDIQKLFENKYTGSDIIKMTEDYKGFSDMVDASTAEQIA